MAGADNQRQNLSAVAASGANCQQKYKPDHVATVTVIQAKVRERGSRGFLE
jgi:hypothetical protein